MNPDAISADAIRDGTHPFHKDATGMACRQCCRPRWAHVDDGHRSNPEHKYTLADTKYRPGPHPYWSRPGAFNKKDPKVHTPFSSGHSSTPSRSVTPAVTGGESRRFPVKPQSVVLIAPPDVASDRVRIATAMPSDGPVKSSPGQGRIPISQAGAETT